ncbi:hypothetical protein FOM00_08190 [Pseudomonas sp. ST1]|nr:hypothetical protein DXU85_05420 [Pseudomonas savastanoi]TSC37493.1 hypothetical protein FOM00_08190 [Pseudomonas sp. ST1]
MRLAWRPARLPPDQHQNSAVTNVALCVVSVIELKSAFRRGVSGQFRPSLPRRVERSSARVLTGPTRALRSFSFTLS